MERLIEARYSYFMQEGNVRVLSERAKLTNNLQAVRQTSEKMFFLTGELKSLCKELELTQDQIKNLKEDLNRIARKLELSLLP